MFLGKEDQKRSNLATVNPFENEKEDKRSRTFPPHEKYLTDTIT